MSQHTSSNPNEFILPDLGEGVAEAELIKWRVKVGDVVREHDILADMETDKALVEVPSPRGGAILELLGSEGQIIKVGSVLVRFGEPASVRTAPAAPAVVEVPRAAEAATGNGHTTHTTASADAGTVVGSMGGALAGLSADGSALATPAVRRLARDLGVNIDAVAGTGIGGRVTEKDVRSATAAGAKVATPLPHPAPQPVDKPAEPLVKVAAPVQPATRPTPALAPTPAPAPAPAPAAPARPLAAPSPTGQDVIRVPFRGVRRTIANRLRESVSNTVHFTVMDEADVSALDALRKRLGAASGEKVSFLPFVAAAVCRCLAGEFAEFNSTTDDAKEEILRHRGVHIGIATDTDNGLMVPVVRDCDKLGVLEISRQIATVAESARNRSAPRDTLMGSTFTISNVGSHAGRFATPIINYPEVGILAVGRARDAVVVRHGGMAVGKVLPLSLACDHRVVDGASAALMLSRIIALLGTPDELLGPARG
ncbi:MAG: dihydrolipoamide acetyltransferase family protein [bacterium]